MTTTTEYPPWRMRYSGEDFDRSQHLAYVLTEADRKAGRPAPECGYSAERFEDAQRIVRAAQR